MELYQISNRAEKMLQIKADQEKIPLGGSLELLPLCNMNCKMCYVRQTREEMDAQGMMLSCDEWLRVAEEGVREGLLFLLLTGGEPLLYPEFRRLYVEMKRMGLILSVNSNGTLLDETWADFFAEHGCRRMNLTLYGKDNETYAELCGNPNGFTQIMRAANLLKERNVAFRLNCSVTPQNVDQLEDFHRIARELEVPLSVATYMFPATRRNRGPEEQNRLTPEKSAAAMLRNYALNNPGIALRLAAKNTLAQLDFAPRDPEEAGFTCHAGHSGFWLNWKGEMMPCGMFSEPAISLRDHSFRTCWEYIVQASMELRLCADCRTCTKRRLCRPCLAHCYTETGTTTGCPEYLCRMTEEEIRLLREMEQAE